MSFSVAHLLVHGDNVPADARAALRDALATPEPARRPLLEAAARSLHRDAALDCADALELVGLADNVRC
jgi:plasmid stability protein